MDKRLIKARIILCSLLTVIHATLAGALLEIAIRSPDGGAVAIIFSLMNIWMAVDYASDNAKAIREYRK